MPVHTNYHFDREKTCCFTGHRPAKLPDGGRMNSAKMIRLSQLLELEIRRLHHDGYRFFISGMAQGFDILAAETILQMNIPGIRLVCALPNAFQANKWNNWWVEKYNSILHEAPVVLYTNYEYTKNSYMNRNRYMVDCSSYVVACYNQNGADVRSGTGATVRYAVRQSVPVRNLFTHL